MGAEQSNVASLKASEEPDTITTERVTPQPGDEHRRRRETEDKDSEQRTAMAEEDGNLFSQPYKEELKSLEAKNNNGANTAAANGGKVLPHNLEAILKDADSPVDRSSMDKLHDQLCAGVFLNQKRKKYWVDRATNRNCFMLFARDLSITWSEDGRFWHWPLVQETSDVPIDVAELLNVCWLEVHGRLELGDLSPGVTYEAVFVVMLRDPAYGWDKVPVNFRISLPDGSKQEHGENLMEKPRGKWVEIPVGEFKTKKNAAGGGGGEAEISLYEYHGGMWKRGLVIKCITIRPKF